MSVRPSTRMRCSYLCACRIQRSVCMAIADKDGPAGISSRLVATDCNPCRPSHCCTQNREDVDMYDQMKIRYFGREVHSELDISV